MYIPLFADEPGMLTVIEIITNATNNFVLYIPIVPVQKQIYWEVSWRWQVMAPYSIAKSIMGVWLRH